MTVLTGIFASLPGLENMPPEGIQKWVKSRIGDHNIENFLANRILYSQSIATTEEEKQIDRAIFQEYIVRNPAYFYNPLTHKLIIPHELVTRIQPFSDLMMIFCSLLQLGPVTPVFLSDGSTVKTEGSILIPSLSPADQKITVSINGKMQTLEKSKFYTIPVEDQRTKIKINNDNEIMVSGGSLGITIDLRNRGI